MAVWLAILLMVSNTRGDINCPENIKAVATAIVLSVWCNLTLFKAFIVRTGNREPWAKPIKQTLIMTTGTLFVNDKTKKGIAIAESITGIR